MTTWHTASKRTAGRKRKASDAPRADDDDEEGTPLPFILPKLMGMAGANSVYSHVNHVHFCDDITEDTAFALCKELRHMETKLRSMAQPLGIAPPPIYLHLQTNGGSIHAAFAIVDCIEGLSVPVHTVCEGYVASAGTLVSLAGERRYISRNAYMLIHELSSSVWGKMHTMEHEMENLKKLMEHLITYYTARTKLKRKALEKQLKKDTSWNADDCIRHGLVHEVWAGRASA